MSESAGDMSSQAANPANPAPVSCISFIACAGTSFDLRTPEVQRYEESLVLSGMTTRVL